MALSNALHSKEITTAQIRALSFGFFSEAEVRVCVLPRVFRGVVYSRIRGVVMDGRVGVHGSRLSCPVPELCPRADSEAG